MDARLQRRVQRYGWDLASTEYDPLWEEQLAPARNGMLAFAALAPDERVLDLACGTGLVTLNAARSVGPGGSVLGTDISGHMIEIAQQRALEQQLSNVAFQRMDAETFDLPRASFDVVLCSLALHHVSGEQRVQALREVARVLRPGGSFHLLEMARGDATRPVNRLVHRSARAHSWGELDIVAMMRHAGLADPVDLGRASKLVGTFAFYTAGSGVIDQQPA